MHTGEDQEILKSRKATLEAKRENHSDRWIKKRSRNRTPTSETSLYPIDNSVVAKDVKHAA